jgi:hypothetical protein
MSDSSNNASTDLLATALIIGGAVIVGYAIARVVDWKVTREIRKANEEHNAANPI